MGSRSCTGWRLGISPPIWKAVSKRERPQSGTDCISRKCIRRDGVVVRYTVCRVPRQTSPRVRVFENNKQVMSFTAVSFDAGQRWVDGMVGR